jgi:hypothetical protein
VTNSNTLSVVNGGGVKTFIFVVTMLLTANRCLAEVYTWEDKDGNHAVNDISSVPVRYRPSQHKSESQKDLRWTYYGSSRNGNFYVDNSTRRPYKGNPSVWAKLDEGAITTKILFVAKCAEHRLFAVSKAEYNLSGEVTKSSDFFDKPSELTVTPESMTEATYDLLCK